MRSGTGAKKQVVRTRRRTLADMRRETGQGQAAGSRRAGGTKERARVRMQEKARQKVGEVNEQQGMGAGMTQEEMAAAEREDELFRQTYLNAS